MPGGMKMIRSPLSGQENDMFLACAFPLQATQSQRTAVL